MPVIAAEQEPEPGQIRAQLRQVVPLLAHEPSKRGRQRLAIRAAEPVPNKAEHLDQLRAVAALKPHLTSRHSAQYRPRAPRSYPGTVSSTNRWRDARVATTARIRRSPDGEEHHQDGDDHCPAGVSPAVGRRDGSRVAAWGPGSI